MLWRSNSTALPPPNRRPSACVPLYEQAGYRKYRASRFEEYALYQGISASARRTGHHLHRPGRQAAGHQARRNAVHRQDGSARGRSASAFYYNEEVCRPQPRAPPFQTIHQMGLESMGAVDADEQAAVVRLALQSLAALDVPTVLEISHMGYLTGLLDALHVPAEARAKLLDFLRAKNAHELRTAAMAAGLDESAAAALTGLLDLHGRWVQR